MISAAALAVWLHLAAPAAAQFGQNHVVVHDFKWKIRSTEHFDIYYYDGSAPLVPEAAQILERAFKTVTKRLDIGVEPPPWLPEKIRKRYAWQRRPFFLFASPNDFEQSNIAFVGDGTGGITEPFKDRFMVYNDGTYQWLNEVTTHEFTHIMQYYLLVDQGFWKSGRILKTIVYPLWMMEGGPASMTYQIEPILQETTIRDAATSDGLIPLNKLEHFGHLKPHQITLAYMEGSEAMQFLWDQYGWRKVGDMIRLFDSRLETSQVLTDLVGLDEFQFDAKFREYAQQKYWRQVRLEHLREPWAFGQALTRTPDNIPQFNICPVFTPDGRFMYYFTTASGEFPPTLREMDLKNGRVTKLPGIPYSPIENVPLGNFANLSRVLDISRDGKRLLFAGTKNHHDKLFLYDLRRRRLSKRELPGFQQISQPAFSPDGRQVVFSGMKGGTTDLYLYDLRTRALRRLTDDPRDEEMPVFTPDGQSIVFSGEVVSPLGRRTDQRRLYRYDLRDGTESRLENVGGQSRDPVISADGKRVLFVLYRDGLSELAELELATGKTTLLTRTIGGSYTPRYAPDGELAFASLRRGSVHIYKGPRAQFLDEPLTPERDTIPGGDKIMLPGMGGVAPSTAPVAALSPERPYKFDFSTDLFLPAFFYSSNGGFFWTSYWQGSDMTGNHQSSLLLNLASGAYNYGAQYSYLRYRPQLTVAAGGVGYKGLTDVATGDTIDDAYHQQAVQVGYPLDRYHRLEAGVSAATERITDHTDPTQNEDREARTGSVAFVRDTVRGRYLVANQGSRLRLAYDQTEDVFGGNRRFNEASLEGQEFIPLGSQTALALRARGVQSLGRDRDQFSLGGLGALRGYGYSTVDDVGNRLALATADLRFPIVRELNYYMWYFFPDFYFKAIFGSIFDDVGYSWNSQGGLSGAHWDTLKNSVGAGVRIYTFILQDYPLIVSLDYAHRTTSNGGVFYVYLGEPF